MAKTYQFATQLEKGKEVERKLDLFFANQFDRIEAAGMAHERAGIDRIYHKGDRRYRVEYKADFKTWDTGNVYAETVAYGKYNEEGEFVVGKPGWVYTSRANFLIYTVMHPEDEEALGTAYVVEPETLRSWMDEWIERYRSVQVRNNGFQGRGILIPLGEFERVSVRVIPIH